MPWDSRGAKRYYYQPVRAGGKPRRIYWGSGDLGRLHELLTADDRRRRAERAQAAAARRERLTYLRKVLRETLWLARQFVRAGRLAAGGYQHKGQWRKRGRLIDTTTLEGTPMSPTHPTPGPAATGAAPPFDLVQLNERANAGDPAALAELEAVLDRRPEVWQAFADLTELTGAAWAGLVAGRDAMCRAVVPREVAAWKAGLGGPNPTPLVTAAVDAAAVAWLAARHAERELFDAPAGKRAAAGRRAATANRHLRDALKLVLAARQTEEARAATAAGVAAAGPAVAPRLFGEVG